jgi:hypothetical protein
MASHPAILEGYKKSRPNRYENVLQTRPVWGGVRWKQGRRKIDAWLAFTDQSLIETAQ